jgi:hypothetical protein
MVFVLDTTNRRLNKKPPAKSQLQIIWLTAHKEGEIINFQYHYYTGSIIGNL